MEQESSKDNAGREAPHSRAYRVKVSIFVNDGQHGTKKCAYR